MAALISAERLTLPTTGKRNWVDGFVVFTVCFLGNSREKNILSSYLCHLHQVGLLSFCSRFPLNSEYLPLCPIYYYSSSGQFKNNAVRPNTESHRIVLDKNSADLLLDEL